MLPIKAIRAAALGAALLVGGWGVWRMTGREKAGPPPRRVLVHVTGHSMSPLLPSGRLVSVELAAPPFRRGEVVVLRPASHRAFLIKRIAAIPGDVLKMERQGSRWLLRVNDRPALNSEGAPIDVGLHRRTLGLSLRHDGGRVPDGSYFVVGDNRRATDDSTIFGFVEDRDIVGRVSR